MTIRAYKSAGGGLAFEAEALSEVAYAHQLNACQELLNRGILSRVDVLRHGTTDLIGCMQSYDPQERINKKLAEVRLRG